MGLHDRPYMRGRYDFSRPWRAGGDFTGGYHPGRVVKTLIVINIIVFIAQGLFRDPIKLSMAVIPQYWWQAWRYLTFQFLHGGIGHILFNMIALYFLGLILEAYWGPKRFIVFYLTCGAAAGLVHVLMTPVLHQPVDVPLVGASGGIFGVLVACAVLFPNVTVLLFFIFPMRLWIVAVGLLLFAFLEVMVGIGAAMEGKPISGGISHPAHLGGAAAAAVWLWVVPKLQLRIRWGGSIGAGRWEKKLEKKRKEMERIDRILDKIRREGINSLTWWEKRILRQASEKQRKDDW